MPGFDMSPQVLYSEYTADKSIDRSMGVYIPYGEPDSQSFGKNCLLQYHCQFYRNLMKL